jgi:hypothetical protein
VTRAAAGAEHVGVGNSTSATMPRRRRGVATVGVSDAQLGVARLRVVLLLELVAVALLAAERCRRISAIIAWCSSKRTRNDSSR